MILDPNRRPKMTDFKESITLCVFFLVTAIYRQELKLQHANLLRKVLPSTRPTMTSSRGSHSLYEQTGLCSCSKLSLSKSSTAG